MLKTTQERMVAGALILLTGGLGNQNAHRGTGSLRSRVSSCVDFDGCPWIFLPRA